MPFISITCFGQDSCVYKTHQTKSQTLDMTPIISALAVLTLELLDKGGGQDPRLHLV